MIHPLWSGKDIAEAPRDNYVIDTNGLSEEDLRAKAPEVWQHLKNTVFPERATNRDPKLSKFWWLFRRANTEVRGAIAGLEKFILTPETSKYRLFVMVESRTMPEHGIVAVGINSYFIYGVLSSSLHELWSLKSGGLLGPTPRYNKTRCFETFPFPAHEEGELKQHIRDLGERLDAHRKRQQEQHPDLTLTGIYNVLEKLRAGHALTAKDRDIHDKGLVSVLKQIHDDLDAAVLEAYGWSDLATATPPADLLAHGGSAAEALEQQLLTRLVALNHERAAEEKRGIIRYLRPDYQNPTSAAPQPVQATLQGTDPDSSNQPSKINNLSVVASAKSDQQSSINPASLLPWPGELPAQVAAINKLVPIHGQDAEALAACFGRKNKKRSDQIAIILATLKALGHIS